MEHLDIISIVVQTVVILVGIGVAWGLLNGTIKSHGSRLTQVEKTVEKLQDVMIIMARFEERYTSMDQRLLAQGVRLDQSIQNITNHMDSTVSIVNGRLEAINNIVAGHTAQLNAAPGRLKPVS